MKHCNSKLNIQVKICKGKVKFHRIIKALNVAYSRCMFKISETFLNCARTSILAVAEHRMDMYSTPAVTN